MPFRQTGSLLFIINPLHRILQKLFILIECPRLTKKKKKHRQRNMKIVCPAACTLPLCTKESFFFSQHAAAMLISTGITCDCDTLTAALAFRLITPFTKIYLSSPAERYARWERNAPYHRKPASCWGVGVRGGWECLWGTSGLIRF